VGVGVAVAVQVSAFVDGHAAHGELDVLPLAGVEPAHEYLLGVAFSAFIGQQDPGCQLEELGGIGARHFGKLIDAKLEIGSTSTDRRSATEHGNVESSGSGWRRPHDWCFSWRRWGWNGRTSRGRGWCWICG